MDKRIFKYILLIIIASIITAFALWNIGDIFNIIGKILLIFRPIIIGFVIAFVLNQPFIKFKNGYRKLLKKKKTEKAATILAVISVYGLLFLILTPIIIIIIIEFSKSFKMFSDNLESYLDNLKKLIDTISQNIDTTYLEDINIAEKLNEYIEKVPSIAGTIIFGAFGFTTSLIKTVTDIFLGLIISIYFLMVKTRLRLQCKKTLYAICNLKKSKKIISVLSQISTTFTNFITGQLIESAILGTLCFLGLTLLGIDYALLISVLIAITNIIPIVGPFIGTIPSVLILLLANPKDAIWFIIFIIILQQIEGNLIYPRVVGTKVGLPALWVLIAIIIGGGLFGILGMLLAVPTMSTIYDLTRKNVNERLNLKDIKIE